MAASLPYKQTIILVEILDKLVVFITSIQGFRVSLFYFLVAPGSGFFACPRLIQVLQTSLLLLLPALLVN
jgi:hypothetical protein